MLRRRRPRSRPHLSRDRAGGAAPTVRPRSSGFRPLARAPAPLHRTSQVEARTASFVNRARGPAGGCAECGAELLPDRWRLPRPARGLASLGGGGAAGGGRARPFAARRGKGGLLRARGGASAFT